MNGHGISSHSRRLIGLLYEGRVDPKTDHQYWELVSYLHPDCAIEK